MQANGALSTARNNVSAALNQIVTDSIAAIGGLKSNLKKALPLPRPPVFSADAETVKLRALQSERIHIRLLSRQARLSEVAKIAMQTERDEIACIAVMEILNADAAENDKHELVESMARSMSRAALPAIVSLLNQGQTELALGIFTERLEQGDFEQLLLNSQAKAFTLLDILGGLDQASETDSSLDYFYRFFDCLNGQEEKQLSLLCEVLGDPKPEGFRYPYEKNMISQPVKLAAIEFLRSAPIATFDRALSYGAKDEDEEVAYQSISQLSNFWRSDEGLILPGLEPYPLLDSERLVHLCKISSAFTWSDVVHADSIIARCKEAAAELANAQPNTVEQLRLQAEFSGLEEQLVRLTERRVNSLQPLLNRITTALGIPHAELKASDDPNSYASYLIGTGTIKVNRMILLDDKPLSEELMSSLLHEIGHLEQDVLVIRMVADDLNLRFGQHSSLLVSLYERYSQGIGYAPRSMFLMAVLRLRDDQPLTPAQRTRALRLLQAMKETKHNHDLLETLELRLTRLTESYGALKEGKYDSQLLTCLKNQRTLNALFNKGEVPAVLLDELSNCKREIDQIVATMNASGAKGLAKDTIAAAQQLYASGHKQLISPIVNRLKTLLMQVLREESAQLEKRLSEIRRSGYHEAEAYTISDRVEVIVKALRQGW